MLQNPNFRGLTALQRSPDPLADEVCIFFSVSENRDNGLGDEGARRNAPRTLRHMGLKPPLVLPRT